MKCIFFNFYHIYLEGDFMDCCRITDLNSKQVINTKTGCHLGFVNDVEINTCDGRVSALIIFGRSRLLGRRDGDIRICWKDIEVSGDDIILVCNSECVTPSASGRRQGIFDNIFR